MAGTRHERGKFYKPQQPQTLPIPHQPLFAKPLLKQPIEIRSEAPPWAFYYEAESLVFPVCTVQDCGSQRIITKMHTYQGTMVMRASMIRIDAEDLLRLHLKEHHGIDNPSDLSKHGFFLPRKIWVRP